MFWTLFTLKQNRWNITLAQMSNYAKQKFLPNNHILNSEDTNYS